LQLLPTAEKSFLPETKAVLRKEPISHDAQSMYKEKMAAIISCLGKVLGAKEEHVHFCKVDAPEFLPVFTEPALGKGRLVLSAPKPRDESEDASELHPATIIESTENCCTIDFGDGSNYQSRTWYCVAAPSSAQEKPQLEIGMPVACPWNAEKIWYKGTIKDILQDGRRIQVGWNDG
jgi:hypothetical protein